MSVVFVDSVGLLALGNANDQWHHDAKAAYKKINQIEATVLTTTFVLLECGNAAARRVFRSDATAIRKQFEEAETLIWPTETDWQQAWLAYQRGEADSAGIVDHVSFAVMRRLGISKAFTNDRHFKAAGFEPMF